tara:strand:- start:8839 stop:9273 length:435 start_codon:yes stop_codon:yes gene_type:complete
MTENGYSRFLYWRITLKMNILNKLRQWFGWLAPIKLAIYFDDFSKYKHENSVTIYTHDVPHVGDHLDLYMGFSGYSEHYYGVVTKVMRYMQITPLAHIGNIGQVVTVYCKKVDDRGDGVTDGIDNPIAEYVNYTNNYYIPNRKH